MSNSPTSEANTDARGKLFIIAAPSGAGKTTLVNAMLKRDTRLVLSISHTTRQPRPGEEDGRHYYFIDEARFQHMVETGDFVEHAQVFDHFYGTNRHTVGAQLKQNRDVILEIDWQGARQVKAVFPDSCAIFVLPPSLDSLKKRLVGRGQDSQKVIDRRMRDARAEISHWAEFDQLLVNDNFDTALDELASIIKDHRLRQPHKINDTNKHLAQQLGRR